MMAEFHRIGRMVQHLNSSFIVLIPKEEDALQLSDYRPISLIGCMYKILAKVLARRLSKVMGSVISESQCAFVENRLIHDGVVVLNEAMEEAKRKKIARIFFKINFANAYDSIE